MRKRSNYNFKLQIISKVCLVYNRCIICWLIKPDHSWAKLNGPRSKHRNDAFGFVYFFFYNSADEKKGKSITIQDNCLYRQILDSEKKKSMKIGLNSINLLKKKIKNCSLKINVNNEIFFFLNRLSVLCMYSCFIYIFIYMYIKT